MGTVERDRIEYVGAEGARAMFALYVEPATTRTRNRRARAASRRPGAQNPAKRQKPAAGTSGRGTLGHHAPARVSCVRECVRSAVSRLRRGPGSDRGRSPDEIALRARPRVVNPSIRPPSIETPRSKPRGPRTGPEGTQMLLVGVSTARTVVSLYATRSRALPTSELRGAHI